MLGRPSRGIVATNSGKGFQGLQNPAHTLVLSRTNYVVGGAQKILPSPNHQSAAKHARICVYMLQDQMQIQCQTYCSMQVAQI
jgi:hypothetical protein